MVTTASLKGVMPPFPFRLSEYWKEKISHGATIKLALNTFLIPTTLPPSRLSRTKAASPHQAKAASPHQARTKGHCFISIEFVFTITTIEVIYDSIIFTGAI